MAGEHRPKWVEPLKKTPLVVVGYHGTSMEYAKRIISDGFKVSRNDHDWLGEGVYFWQDAPQRALEWSKNWYKSGKGKRGVVKATVQLKDCMDLLDNDWNVTIQEASKAFLKKLEAEGITRRNNDQKKGRNRLDCAFYNYLVGILALQGVEIATIRTAVTEGDPVLPESPICFDSHVQIAVRDVSLISDVALVYTE